MILGIDEVGRGPWAGPLVVGAVVLGGAKIEGLTDSKKLTKKRREILEVQILEQAQACALGWVTAGELDEIGMSEALRLATRRAVEQIKVPYHEIILDGTINFLSNTSKGQYVTTMPKADLLVPSVSAASIIAKVARDRYMTAQDDIYPGYGFAGHAGYGVAKHREAIERFGVTPLHRLSFAPLTKYSDSAQLPQKQPRSRQKSTPKPTLVSAELAVAQTSSKRKEVFGALFGASQIVSDEAVQNLTTRKIGDLSETAAAEELVRRGHVILERNWKNRFCEIDIVSQYGDTVYFVEVKHRRNDDSGDGLAAITPQKLRQMTFATQMYAKAKQVKDINLRLAVMTTTGNPPQFQTYLDID